jgi:hypothetical protein
LKFFTPRKNRRQGRDEGKLWKAGKGDGAMSNGLAENKPVVMTRQNTLMPP